MPIETNLTGDPIIYEYPYADLLDENEKELYWSATQEAEDALAKICCIQRRRSTKNGDISRVLLPDHFHELKDAIAQLSDAITLLYLIDKSVAWTEEMADKRESLPIGDLLESMEDADDSEEDHDE